MTRRKRAATLKRIRSLRRWAWFLGITTVLAMAVVVLTRPRSPSRQPAVTPAKVPAPAVAPKIHTPPTAPEAQAPPPISPPAVKGKPEFSGACQRSFDAAFTMPLGQGCTEGLTTQPKHTLVDHVCYGLHARVGAAPGPGACWVVALTEFTLPTAMSCKVCGGATECAVSARDGITTSNLEAPVVRFVPTGTPRPTRGASFALDCV